jgi:hypothetical protein
MEGFKYEKVESAFRRTFEVDKKFTKARLNLGLMSSQPIFNLMFSYVNPLINLPFCFMIFL